MITETLTLHFQDAEQQKRFHERLNTPDLNIAAHDHRSAELEMALRGIVNHWNEFGGMMGINDDYGMGERMDAAEKLIR